MSMDRKEAVDRIVAVTAQAMEIIEDMAGGRALTTHENTLYNAADVLNDGIFDVSVDAGVIFNAVADIEEAYERGYVTFGLSRLLDHDLDTVFWASENPYM